MMTDVASRFFGIVTNLWFYLVGNQLLCYFVTLMVANILFDAYKSFTGK